MHETTFRVEISASPDISITRSAYEPQFGYALTGVPTWIWEDAISDTKKRFRISLTARPPTSKWYSTIPSVNDALNDIVTTSVDFQIFLSPNSESLIGDVEFEGDKLPSIAVYRYLGCSVEWKKVVDQRHEDSRFAFTELIKFDVWRFDRKYPR